MSDTDPTDHRGPMEKASGPQHALINGKSDGSLSLLDRLSATRGVWELLDANPQQATELLAEQPAGTFIITRNIVGDASVILIRTQEGGTDAVCYFPILEESSAVHLEGSHLRFQDLLELVSFHTVSRDILPDLLRVPDAFQFSCKPGLDALTALGTEFWTMSLKLGTGLASAEEGSLGSSREPHASRQSVGSIQVTSEHGALCIINPLFISVHGETCWLDSAPNLCRTNSKRGTLRLQNGRGSLQASGSTAVSCKQETRESLHHQESLEEEGVLEKGGSAPHSTSARRKFLLRGLACTDSGNVSDELPPSPDALPKEGRSPHRVSWIEAAPGTASPSWPLAEPDSGLPLLNEPLVLPPIPELDSLSLSSMEDEGESLPPAALHKKRSSSALLTYKVLHHLSAVGSTLSGLLSVERRISNRVQELAQEPASYLGGLVQSFVGHILRGAGTRHPTSTDMLQEIRQMISSLKGYLCESSELRAICEHSEVEEIDLGSVVEAALYKCILKPLRDTIYAQLLDFHTRDGTLSQLREHQAAMTQQSLVELGVSAGVPDGAGLERILAKLSLLHQAYSPKKKETQMLKVCKVLYEAMNRAAGRTEPFGADDFLPALTYVLLNCDIGSVQLDVEYMMELMDPSQLQGEGGYYLTTWFGVLYHIANYQPAALVTRQISAEAQHSIHQWQRRRTIYHHHAHRSYSQNILYVSFHEPFNNQKSILVPSDTTTESVCEMCAKKYSVPNPEAYGLFLMSGDSSQLLAGDVCPRRLHSDILQTQGPPVSFVYKAKGEGLPAAVCPPLQKPDSLTEAQDPFKSLGTGPSAVD